mgnify:FL=1
MAGIQHDDVRERSRFGINEMSRLTNAVVQRAADIGSGHLAKAWRSSFRRSRTSFQLMMHGTPVKTRAQIAFQIA